MKLLTVAVAALATAAASVSAANFTIFEPWGETTWTAGETGVVTWSASDDILQSLCEIHLLTGSATAATFVANFTANGNLVPCNYTKANLHPLPDYASGQYFIRMGPNGATTDQYTYSGVFNYVGNGTVLPGNETPATASSTAAPAPAVTDAAIAESA